MPSYVSDCAVVPCVYVNRSEIVRYTHTYVCSTRVGTPLRGGGSGGVGRGGVGSGAGWSGDSATPVQYASRGHLTVLYWRSGEMNVFCVPALFLGRARRRTETSVVVIRRHRRRLPLAVPSPSPSPLPVGVSNARVLAGVVGPIVSVFP